MRDQKSRLSFASIVVVGLVSKDKVAIEAISVTLDSCDLSGAWLIDVGDTVTIESLLNGKLVLFLNQESESVTNFKKYKEKIIVVQDLISDAKSEIKTANKLFEEYVQKNQLEYSEYMKIPPSERRLLPKIQKKSLVAPEFSAWPDSVLLDSAEEELVRMQKLGSVAGTPNEMKKILAASRLIQFLIYMWKADEIERVNRVYVLGQDSEQTILPPSWLKKI
jgi:hypothetical protein